MRKILAFLNDESGPTSVEYAVLLALILVACITVVGQLGQSSNSTFSKVNAAMPAPAGGS